MKLFKWWDFFFFSLNLIRVLGGPLIREKRENVRVRIRNGYMDFVSLIKEQEKDQTFSTLAINFYTLPYFWRTGLHCKLVLLHYSVLQCFPM